MATWGLRLSKMFKLVHVSDFEAKGAFDEAFKDPAMVVEPVIKGTINSLEAAVRAGVKRYVLSSSSKAVESTNYNYRHHITSSMFNYGAIWKACCEANFDGLDRFMDVYSASRALAELPFWSWNTASAFRMLKAAAEGEWDKVFGQVAYYTDVQDAARLLVAAVALPSILRCKIRLISSKGEKLVKGEDQAVEGKDLSNADGPIKRAKGILREIGQQGFASEEDILRYFLDCL
ncbi:hypothetical protein DER46DRAFT_619775 [Fusarium sp. MPI-SDFR-AT-0072]|nr:hypothetical protein DER46DRAFT_619775 [Fusarium sp. MPI-SDFR-AT-0072]